MLNPKVEQFLEKHNMNYMFLLCANLEVKRLSSLPNFVKEKFEKKLTETALEHVAENEIPDYAVEEEIPDFAEDDE
jgi:hypothetical protein